MWMTPSAPPTATDGAATPPAPPTTTWSTGAPADPPTPPYAMPVAPKPVVGRNLAIGIAVAALVIGGFLGALIAHVARDTDSGPRTGFPTAATGPAAARANCPATPSRDPRPARPHRPPHRRRPPRRLRPAPEKPLGEHREPRHQGPGVCP